ncbi:MAG: hypothetical protein U0872_10515 [Planctomycetaceae bacterium]
MIAILATAFLLRLVCAVGIQRHLDQGSREVCLIPGDADGYWRLAGKITQGQDYAIYEPPRSVMRMPGFPLLLALPRFVFPESLLAARVWLAAIGVSACWFTYLLGKGLVSGPAGLWGAAITALSPVLAVFSVLILSETPFAAALTASLVLFVKLDRRLSLPIAPGERWSAVSVGLAIAVATLMRPTWLLIAPIVALGCLRRADFPRRFQAGLLVIAAAYGALLPWGIRNAAVTGHFTLTTFWVGPSLYDGLNPDATGDSDMRFFDEENLLTRMSEYDMDREYRRRAWQFAADHPSRTLELMAMKLWRYLSPWPNARQFQSPTVRLIVTISFLALLLPALFGTWQLRQRPMVLAVTWGPLIYFAAVHVWFVGSIRYRLPAEYPLAVLSGAALAAGFRIFTAPKQLAKAGDA